MASKKSKTFSKDAEMSAHSEAQTLVMGLVSRYPNGTPFKAYAPPLASRLRLTVRRLRAIIYGEARRIDADELDRIRSIAAPKSLPIEETHARQLEAIASALEAQDPDFHRSTIDLHRNMALQLRRSAADGAVAR